MAAVGDSIGASGVAGGERFLPRAVRRWVRTAIAPDGFILDPFADAVLLIFSPLLALAIGYGLSTTSLVEQRVFLFGHSGTITDIAIGVVTMAHLPVVFFRSHANPGIFKLHRIRFTLVPIVLFAAMCASSWVAVSIAVLAAWWDVYHSAMQTFGLGRIYDAKQANDAGVGRGLDAGINLLIYAGPILGGATLMDHVAEFYRFGAVGSAFFTSIPAHADAWSRQMTWAICAFAVPYLAFYVFSYIRLSRQGYRVSFQKLALLVSTAICSIVAWGFNSFGEAFLVMNLFHAVQYFALVWHVEQANLMRVFSLRATTWGKLLALIVFLELAFAYGFCAEFFGDATSLAFNALLVVSIMHFWYDGFVWSVRKNQVG